MVICDSSARIHLSAIGRLDLLKVLYGKVAVPTAVWRVVVEQGATSGDLYNNAIAQIDQGVARAR